MRRLFQVHNCVHSTSGFTLLEVMIAMAILAIVLVAAYQSQSQSISMTSNSHFLTTASLLAQGKMTEVDALQPNSVISGNGDFGENFPGWHWKLDVSDAEDKYLKKLELTVTNESMKTNNSYQVVLYKMMHG